MQRVWVLKGMQLPGKRLSTNHGIQYEIPGHDMAFDRRQLLVLEQILGVGAVRIAVDAVCTVARMAVSARHDALVGLPSFPQKNL